MKLYVHSHCHGGIYKTLTIVLIAAKIPGCSFKGSSAVFWRSTAFTDKNPWKNSGRSRINPSASERRIRDTDEVLTHSLP